ncbi:MAG TPA: 16S rRNA (cytidine(1402)-2'-O)-methyltransferase [Xanthobacteraceae bacterium]|nr:16S rRNA (cytidine(1402)-2'-O)-methyltransferase [Xanthobacteraceae bacterium]
MAERAIEKITLAPGLYVVATPIGNLADISLRALATLQSADLVLCEDTRVTLKLLDRYGLKPKLFAYHEHNAAAMRPKILKELAAERAVALVSDAGTPLISDPGFKLVAEALESGFRVYPVPGASALLAALVAAGLPTDRFFFEGFLPPKSGQRKNRVAELKTIPSTLVLYETGPRLGESLRDLSGVLGAREAAVCRELTKTFEEVRRGSLDELAAHVEASGAPKGEIVIVVAPPDAAEPISSEELDDKLKRALERGSLKDAVALVTEETGMKRRDVYARALVLENKN